ncbi:MAG: hypothetical protein HZA22_06270 [Nitrospirae bacterium]|nr:hypothetical protein [Nitrospirota bacterium]MBI5695684.1 hypothetical protein [Nitrospirota bacterium]
MTKLQQLEEEIKALKESIGSKPMVEYTQLYDLGSDRFALRAPLNITLEFYEDEVIAKLPEVEVWGAGNTESLAILDFKGQLVSMYEDLVEFEADGTLGKLPRMWLKALKKIIVEEP